MCHAPARAQLTPLLPPRAASPPVGPVCWQECKPGYVDEGALCRKDGSIVTYAKRSYGRGVGSALTCAAADPDEDAGLCYPTCPTVSPLAAAPRRAAAAKG